MTQNEHYIVAAIQWIITWYGFWSPLFSSLVTKQEKKYWDKKSGQWIDKILS